LSKYAQNLSVTNQRKKFLDFSECKLYKEESALSLVDTTFIDVYHF